jgi:hypothetical protein
MVTEAPVRRHPHAAFRVYDTGEAFVVVPGLGEYNILNAVGTRVWELIDNQRTVQDIVQVLSEEYDAPIDKIEADVRELIDNLKKHQMVS